MYNSIYIVDQEGGHMETLIFTNWLRGREGFLSTPNPTSINPVLY